MEAIPTWFESIQMSSLFSLYHVLLVIDEGVSSIPRTMRLSYFFRSVKHK